MKNKKILIVGTGIQASNHMTLEAKKWIEESDVVLHAIADPLSLKIVESLNQKLVCLNDYYIPNRPLLKVYDLMVERIMDEIEKNDIICVAMYGHPGTLVESTHRAFNQAKEKGYDVRMLPGISSFACLTADLNIDPARNGCIMVEATDLIVHNRSIDLSYDLIIWQVGFIGELKYQHSGKYRSRIDLLKELLLRYYNPESIAIFYVASQIPLLNSKIIKTNINNLDKDIPPTISTLYIPAVKDKDVNQENFNKFKFDNQDLNK